MFNGSFIPNAILKCRALSATAKLLFGRLSQYAGQDGEAFPSYSTLGQEVGIERRQTIRAVRELGDFGLIRAVRRQKGDGSLSSNGYAFLWHSIFTDDDSQLPGAKNGAGGSVTNDTTPQCHRRHQVVSEMTPKEIQTREGKTTTEQVRLLLSETPLSGVSDPELRTRKKKFLFHKCEIYVTFYLRINEMGNIGHIIMFDLGNKIRQARKEKRLTQAKLAEMVGITRRTLGQIETGAVSDIGIRKVERTLEALGLELTVRPAGAPPTLEELQKENTSR